jgi:hypothetical protein
MSFEYQAPTLIFEERDKALMKVESVPIVSGSLLGDHALPGARNVAPDYLSTIFNGGAAFGAVLAGAFAIFIGIPAIFRLAAVIILSGAIMVTLYAWRVESLHLQRKAWSTK